LRITVEGILVSNRSPDKHRNHRRVPLTAFPPNRYLDNRDTMSPLKSKTIGLPLALQHDLFGANNALPEGFA